MCEAKESFLTPFFGVFQQEYLDDRHSLAADPLRLIRYSNSQEVHNLSDGARI